MKKYLHISFFLFGLNFTSLAQNKAVSVDGIATVKLIKFYPNPASSVITFEFNKTSDNFYSLQVYNFMGKKVYDVKKMPSRITINLEDFYRGIYIFQVRDKNGAITQSGKFQVVK